MRIPASLGKTVDGERGMLRGIEVCVGAQCLMSAVSLVYSTIDALAALTRPVDKENTDRTTFIAWTRKYLLASGGLKCTAEDVYGARCGVLHNYGHESAMTRCHKAKPLVYRWREGPPADSSTPLPPKAIEVAVEDLVSALKEGVRLFREDVDADTDLEKKVLAHLTELFCYKPWPPLGAYVPAQDPAPMRCVSSGSQQGDDAPGAAGAPSPDGSPR